MTSAKTGWHLILYKTGLNESGQLIETKVDELGNYPNLGNRQSDEIVTFSGMYGIGDYLLWIIHKNIKNYDFASLNIDLKLFPEGSKDAPLFHERYKIVDVYYNQNISKYVVHAVSETTWLLNTQLKSLWKPKFNYIENRKPYEVLQELLEGILTVEYQEYSDPTIIDEFEYRQLVLNPEWTVLEAIDYICDDNDYEYYLIDKKLYVGKELYSIEGENSTRKYNITTDNMAESSFFRKINGTTRPIKIMSHLGKVWRCIWFKHSAGASGGMTKACFYKISYPKFSKWLYYQTLEGKIERYLGLRLLRENKISHYNTIGNIQSDEGNEYIDEVSVQRNSDEIVTRTPRDVKIDREKDNVETGTIFVKKKVCRSTPYADHEAGLLFPSPKLDNPPPNSIIHNIEGREEASIVGNYVLGNGRETFSIPVKNKGDLRLQLPNGWCLYIKENGDTILQPRNMDSQTIPDEIQNSEGISFLIKDDYSEFRVMLDGNNLITYANNENGFLTLCDGTFSVSAVKSILLRDDQAINSIKVGESGDPIEIKSLANNIEIDGSAINLGASATLGVARQTDNVDQSVQMAIWMTAVTAATGVPALVGTQIGDISSASIKVKSE